MAIAKTIEAPEWVDSGSQLTGGLDLLGLRNPVQTIGGSLIDGVTTVSPSIRYIGFRAWLIYRYAEGRRPDSLREFTNFGGICRIGSGTRKPQQGAQHLRAHWGGRRRCSS